MRAQQLTLWPEAVSSLPAAAGSPPGEFMTREACEAFLAAHRGKAGTRAHYRETFRRLQLAHRMLPSLAWQVEAFLAGQRNARTGALVAASTRDGYYRDLRCFFGWLAKRFDTPNPCAGVPRERVTRALPEVLSSAEVDRLLLKTRGRDRALIAFLLDTGARVSEAAGVRRPDITRFQTLDGTLRYQVRLRGVFDSSSGERRLKTGERNVPLSSPAAALLTGVGEGELLWLALRSHRAARAGDALGTSGVQQLVRRLSRAILGREVGPHVLRHTFATMYLRAGGDLESLRRILGHARVQTTLIYLHLVDDDLSNKHALYSPLAQRAEKGA